MAGTGEGVDDGFGGIGAGAVFVVAAACGAVVFAAVGVVGLGEGGSENGVGGAREGAGGMMAEASPSEGPLAAAVTADAPAFGNWHPTNTKARTGTA
ncbi:MAG TPA: hypothetical protein VIJ96_00500 [Acidothermaceae bacterium]